MFVSLPDVSLSGDGRYVAFSSSADDFIDGDTNGFFDVFRYDRTTGETIRVSVAGDGGEGDAASGDYLASSLSSDGRYVAFDSSARNLVPDDANQAYDVFLHDCLTGETLCVSTDVVGTTADRTSEMPALSDDGRILAFVSRATTLVPDDANFADDVFVFQRDLLIEASTVEYGVGTAGTNGVPGFTAQTLPEFGGTLTLDLGNSLGKWTVAFIVAGSQQADLPFAGGSLLVSPIALLLLLPIAPAGSSYDFDIARDVELYDLVIDAQLVEFDAGAPKGLSMSTGLELALGR